MNLRAYAPLPAEPEVDENEGTEVWLCYECRDGLCNACVGPPCACRCPWPKEEPRPDFEI